MLNTQLVIQLQEGNLDALGELYDHYHLLVYRTALGITGDPEAASDLLQDVFLRLYRFKAKIDPARPLEPWLYRMTVNLSRTWLKQQKWLQPLENIAEWISGETKHTPSPYVENKDQWHQIEQALAAMPFHQRAVIVMYYLNDLSLQDIAEILGIPVGTVKSRLYYGRAILKEHLETFDGELPKPVYKFTF
jgi:RNA polymerase sigma-70 factor (ECF subfamily)